VNWDEALERVRETAEFCAGAGLVRVRVDDEHLAIEIRRSARPERPRPSTFETSATGEPDHVALSSNGSGHATVVPTTLLRAEFVGVVRLARPTVAEGATIVEDRELAYVESLGIRNPIRASGPGRVAKVYVTDGQIVDFGAPLFAIEPSDAS
jgi:acetyl-CoA carboxylase biotin carboxyl carrier protein